ncbi:MAG: hypothetical protein NT104_05590 [Bacteroidetes bacterium]|nr:hypothetical protein [Bacteroidota bacterium]
MNKRYLPITLLILFILGLGACQHDIITINAGISLDTILVVKPPITTPAGGTPATLSDTVCFNSDILPLYVSYCGSAGCHSASSHKEGVITTDYGHIMNGIKANNSKSSKYYTIINSGMPPRGSAAMSTAQIALIKKWIDQGALNTQCTNVCDTTSFTYAAAIQTILSNNCGGCHGTQPGSLNVYLGDYASTKAYITANKVLFINAINHSTTLTALQRMPPSNKMLDCKIIQIQKWIQNGYPQ